MTSNLDPIRILQRRTSPDGVTWYVSPLLQQIGVIHAFSTRIGGVSEGPFHSLNLGNPSGSSLQDTPQNIRENYRLLLSAIGCAGRTLCRVHQVHGSRAVSILPNEPLDPSLEADAILTSDPARVLTIRTADCVPLLLADTTGRHVAAIHAGWRGVIAGVLPATIQALCQSSPHLQSRSFVLAIGPCIGPDAFEVGPEVLAAFTNAFPHSPPVERHIGDKGLVNLRHALFLQACAAGIPAEQIDSSDRCTYRNADEFFSHRRDNGVTGRMAAVICCS